MNIKSNKLKSTIDIGNLIRQKEYWIVPIISIIIVSGLSLLNTGWGVIITLMSIGFVLAIIHIIVNENERLDRLRWSENEKLYGTKGFNWFAVVALPLLILISGYVSGIKPMLYDYNHSERIDKILPLKNNTKLFYNDINRVFVLFIEGQKQPLIIDRSGNSDSYNRLKAGFLDKKIKVVKKEMKSWNDDKSEISFYLDDYKFD